MRSLLTEPYRLFFPLGLLLGLWGVTLWVLFVLFKIPYPATVHSYLMIGGFLTAFTTGFLMTAVPRFTGTFHPEIYELGISFLGLVLLPFVSWMSIVGSSALLILLHLNLVLFFVRRFLKRRAPLPHPFLFIPTSLLISILGHGLIILSLGGWLSSVYYSMGKLLAFYAFMLGIVLGVGSKIIPAFTGQGLLVQKNGRLMLGVVALFFSSFFIELFLNLRLGLSLRFLTIFYVAFRIWRIHQKPMNPSKLSFGLWISCWCLLIGVLGGSLFPRYLLEWNHVVFIGGFGLMTLMIGSRVIIAHGGFDLVKEGENPWIAAIIGALLLTSCVRVLIHLFSTLSMPLLLCSATLWIFTLIFWWIKVGSKTTVKLEQKSGQTC